MENSKTSRYFKYAIGEILLVVIGILIALQINTWNENRKLENKTQTYLRLLLEDFKQESVKINAYLKDSKKLISNYEAYEEKFNQSNMSFSEILRGLQTISIGGAVTPTYGINTIDVLKSTGHISLISVEIREKLIELNRFHEYLNHVTKRNRTLLLEELKELGRIGWNPSAYRLSKNSNIKRIRTKMLTDERLVEIIYGIESAFNDRYKNELNRVKTLNKLLKDMADIEELINAELEE